EGDSISIYGVLDQYNGLLQIVPDSIQFHTSGVMLAAPRVSAQLSEAIESRLTEIKEVHLIDPSQWVPSGGGGFNVDITNGTDTFEIRVYATTGVYTSNLPAGYFDI